MNFDFVLRIVAFLICSGALSVTFLEIVMNF